MERNYWLHRISHKMELAYPLLNEEQDEGYVSIGFSAFLKNPEFLNKMNDQSFDGKWQLFEDENIKIWGDTLYRTRYNLWRFLCEFKLKDWIVIPSWKTFYVYEIIGEAIPAGKVEIDDLKDWNGNKVISYVANGDYLSYEDGRIIDIGFVRRVKKIAGPINRELFAENALLSRMKIRQTNANITDLANEINMAVNRSYENKPIKIYFETVDRMSEVLDDSIKRIISNDQFEKLVKFYFERIGADDVVIPSKQSGEGEADSDVIATFEKLKLIIYVQVKHHTGTTNQKAVDQISGYINQKANDADISDYSSIAWVISSAEDFSEEAKMKANSEKIRLINGVEFRRMLIDAGIGGLERII